MDVSRQVSDTEDIADNSITTAKIASSQVTTAKIADSNVTTAKIADSNVTTSKLASGERMTTTNVNAKIASTSAGAIGSYAFLRLSVPASTTRAAGYTASSGLTYAGIRETAFSGDLIMASSGTPSGTWRLMGSMSNSDASARNFVSVWVRVS